MGSVAVEQRNQEATLYVGNLEARVTEELVWELFTQCGPLTSVSLPRDRVAGTHYGYGFVEFRNERDAEYAQRVMNMVRLFGSPVRVGKSAADKRSMDIGARLFIGNLDPAVDEKLLHDTFSAFGTIESAPCVRRDEEVGTSRGYGFLAYDSFEAADLAIQCMHKQFLCNRQINVEYAFKKEGRGERHGSQAERLLAKELRARQGRAAPVRPNVRFATTPAPPAPPPPQANGAPHMMMGMGQPPPLPPPPRGYPPHGMPMGMGMGMPMGQPPPLPPPPPPR